MQNKWSRATLILLSVFIAVFAATSAMAYVLTARPQEMLENSDCDNAGTIRLTFTENDQQIIANHWAANGRSAELRVFLSGTDVPPGIELPTLCSDIRNPDAPLTPPAGGEIIPDTGNVPWDAMPLNRLGSSLVVAGEDGEVSNYFDTTSPDVRAWVKGDAGDQFFTIWIREILDTGWTNPNRDPWIRIGLYDPQNVNENLAFNTPICARVREFAGIAKLTVSINNTPPTLTTTTSDDRIGIFQGNIEVRDCAVAGKGDTTTEQCSILEPDSIPLCPIVGEQQVNCNSYYHCAVVEGLWPLNEMVNLTVRSFADILGQDGVYLQNIQLKDLQSGAILPAAVTFFRSNGNEVTNADNCDFLAQTAVAQFNSSALTGQNNTQRGVVVCIKYTIDPEQAVAGTNVEFTLDGTSEPCGDLFSAMRMGAALTACDIGGEEPVRSCLYFPYVLSQTGPWSTGLAIANLSQEVDIADMEATFTLYDSAGNVFEYTETDFQGKMFPFVLDEAIVDWDWDATPTGAAVEPGAAWLYVETNFTVDGFNFTTDSNFGGTSLPRVLRECGNFNLFK